MCWGLIKGCLQKFRNLIGRMDWNFTYDGHIYSRLLHSTDKLHILNCDYLPSSNSSIPCFYKPVTCDSPPDVTNTSRLLNVTQKDICQLHNVVQYECINETFEIIGKSTISCLYSGQWSHPPPKCIHQQMNSWHPIYVVLPVLIMSLIIYTTLTLFAWCQKTNHQRLTRNKQFDAFVCYSYEGQDHDFAEIIVPLNLEEDYGLKLCIHRRDFKAGWDIKWNVMNVIRNSKQRHYHHVSGLYQQSVVRGGI